MSADDVERLISLVQNPSGDDASLRVRAEYVRRLIDIGDEAEERVSHVVKSGVATNLPLLMEVLAAFGSRDAAEVLCAKLEAGPEAISEAAANALSRHPTRWAVEALSEGIQSKKVPVVVASLVALRQVEAFARCDTLMPLLNSADRRIRFHTVHLAWQAGCLQPEALRALLGDESDPEIREVITTLANAGHTITGERQA
jgi:HEAT repeat protein